MATKKKQDEGQSDNPGTGAAAEDRQPDDNEPAGLEIDLSAGDDAGEGQPQTDPEADPPRKTRQEYRQERREDVIAAEREARAAAEARLAAAEARLRAIESATPPPPAARSAEKDGDDKIARIERRSAILQRAYSAPDTTPEEKAEIQKEYRDLQREYARALAGDGEQKPQQRQAAEPEAPRLHPIDQALASEYPDAYDPRRPHLNEEWRAEAKRMIAAGKPLNARTAREAIEATLKRHGILQGAPSGPSDDVKARYAGASPRTAASGEKSTFKPTKQQLRLARQMFKDADSDEEAVKRWIAHAKRDPAWRKANPGV